MAWVFSTSGQAIRKAGLGANSTISASGQALFEWSDEVEDYLCVIARSDLITNYSSLTSNGKKILQLACSAYIAMNIIDYDESNYIDSREAETKFDLLDNQFNQIVRLLQEDKNKTYLGIA